MRKEKWHIEWDLWVFLCFDSYYFLASLPQRALTPFLLARKVCKRPMAPICRCVHERSVFTIELGCSAQGIELKLWLNWKG